MTSLRKVFLGLGLVLFIKIFPLQLWSRFVSGTGERLGIVSLLRGSGQTRQRLKTGTMISQSELLSFDTTRIQAKFDAEEIDSVGLVSAVLDQVKRHNQAGLNLRALISVTPEEKLLERARELDQQRAEGKSLGRLHGIPVILKVCSATPKFGS